MILSRRNLLWLAFVFAAFSPVLAFADGEPCDNDPTCGGYTKMSSKRKLDQNSEKTQMVCIWGKNCDDAIKMCDNDPTCGGITFECDFNDSRHGCEQAAKACTNVGMCTGVSPQSKIDINKINLDNGGNGKQNKYDKGMDRDLNQLPIKGKQGSADKDRDGDGLVELENVKAHCAAPYCQAQEKAAATAKSHQYSAVCAGKENEELLKAAFCDRDHKFINPYGVIRAYKLQNRDHSKVALGTPECRFYLLMAAQEQARVAQDGVKAKSHPNPPEDSDSEALSIAAQLKTIELVEAGCFANEISGDMRETIVPVLGQAQKGKGISEGYCTTVKRYAPGAAFGVGVKPGTVAPSSSPNKKQQNQPNSESKNR